MSAQPNGVGARPASFQTETRLGILGSLTLLVLLSPLFLAAAVAIKLDTSGPILFKRRVIGLGGTPFIALKFRSMMVNTHELLTQDSTLLQQYQRDLKIVNDPRVTRVGHILRKISLDELPQLINILRGDMSLVGPRMLGDVELARYGDVQDKVLSVKPGLTGLWQVKGRHTVSFERRMEFDLCYVDHWNLWLDLVSSCSRPPLWSSVAKGRARVLRS